MLYKSLFERNMIIIFSPLLNQQERAISKVINGFILPLGMLKIPNSSMISLVSRRNNELGKVSMNNKAGT